MNKKLQKQAEKIFRANWAKSKMKISHKEFIEGFPTLYNTQIIPSIVQALELKDEHIMCESCHKWSHLDNSRFQPEDGLWFCNPCWDEAVEDEKKNPIIEEDDSFFEKDLLDKYSITPKIQPGQKLKDGDYFEGGTIEQYRELMIGIRTTDVDYTLNLAVKFGVHFYLDILYISRVPSEDNKTKYEFDDFKQLCINTFGDGK